MWTKVANQWHFIFSCVLYWCEQIRSLSGSIFSVLTPIGAALEIGIEGLAISRLMRQTKPKLIRAESLPCSLFDLWLIASEWFTPACLWSPIPHQQNSAAVIHVQHWFQWFNFTNLPIKGLWFWRQQESGVRVSGYWMGLIVEVNYDSRAQTFKGPLSEIYFQALLQFGAH